ncbi:MAG: hypothetical protein SVV67_11240 [Bacillota bacterium]|nr:hypothetical protein [Bacillota bacterium]
MAGGKNGMRKYNRNRNKPSCKRYTAERRWVKNKERRIAKQARKEEKKRIRAAGRAKLRLVTA